MEATKMTPEERERYDRIKKSIERKLHDLEEKERLFEAGTANQKAHVAEQMEAFLRDVKAGKAFEGDHWKIATVEKGRAVPDSEWILVLQKLDRLASRERRVRLFLGWYCAAYDYRQRRAVGSHRTRSRRFR
jgi:hypothetical protein